MRFRFTHLQHYIVFIVSGSALVLSVFLSVLAYQFNLQRAKDEGVKAGGNLLSTMQNTASAAAFSENISLSQEIVETILKNDFISSARFIGGPADVSSASHAIDIFLKNPGSHEMSESLKVDLYSPFDESESIGRVVVTVDKNWVSSQAVALSLPMIGWVVFVVFLSGFISTQLIKKLISKPLMEVQRQLQEITAGDYDRLTLPKHLHENEIGVLVSEFNLLLARMAASFEIERNLIKEMESVQKRLEKAKLEAESAADAKSDFLATMSHEIRTPLTGVLGMLKFALNDKDLREDTRSQIEIGLNNAESLMKIINDILDLSKVEAGKLKIEEIHFNIHKQIESALIVFHEMAANKSLDFNLHFDASIPEVIVSDPTRIRQVLINFVSNAIKFTSVGGVSVNIFKQEGKAGNEFIVFSVNDTGIGIDDHVMPRLFQKFEQADISTTRKYAGTGLGLAICKSLVEAMGGEIEVESKSGSGSTFSFSVPLVEGEPLMVEVEAQELPPHTHQLNILCAEDYPTNQHIIRSLIEDKGHRITIVENGKEALVELQNNEYDLILMDGRMPEMDGIEATKFIREGSWQDEAITNPKIRIIALTANVTQEDKLRHLEAGMDAFLTKPIDESALHIELTKTIEMLRDSGAELNPLIRSNETELDDLFGVDTSKIEKEEAPAPNLVQAKSIGLEQQLVSIFVDDLPSRINEIESAMNDKNFEELGRLFHGIKGSAAYINNDDVSNCASLLEKYSDNHEWPEIETHYAMLKNLLEPYTQNNQM